MKLIYCPECEDVRKIHWGRVVTRCKCGKSEGYYEADGVHAWYGGLAVPLGIENNSLTQAVQEWSRNCDHPRAFVAFIIEAGCPTFAWKGIRTENLSYTSWTPSPRAGGRMEWKCEHGVGHGSHIHGCDGCCSRDDYPGKGVKR